MKLLTSAYNSESALKIIKTYCMSTQDQNSLSSIVILTIEKKILENLIMSPDFYNIVIEKFVEEE